MKKTLLIAVVITAILAFSAEKKYHLELNERQASRMLNDLITIQQIADGSQLPHNQVKYIVSAIDSIKADLLPQFQKQQDSTGKK